MAHTNIEAARAKIQGRVPRNGMISDADLERIGVTPQEFADVASDDIDREAEE